MNRSSCTVFVVNWGNSLDSNSENCNFAEQKEKDVCCRRSKKKSTSKTCIPFYTARSNFANSHFQSSKNQKQTPTDGTNGFLRTSFRTRSKKRNHLASLTSKTTQFFGNLNSAYFFLIIFHFFLSFFMVFFTCYSLLESGNNLALGHIHYEWAKYIFIIQYNWCV